MFTILDNGRSFTRSIREVRAIELESRCSLHCVYCPSPKIGTPGWRPRQSMPRAVWERALEWVRYFVAQGTQNELNLAGIGESTMHPDLPEVAMRAREIIGPHRLLTFTTNGLAMTRELADALVPSGVKVGVSLHRPEKARPAIDILRERGLLLEGGVSADPSIAAISWAGQVEWPCDVKMRCGWLMDGMVMVASDGRVLSCCLDARGTNAVGGVDDDPARLLTHPGPLCVRCHHEISVPGFRQR